jgi:hypothetical protein
MWLQEQVKDKKSRLNIKTKSQKKLKKVAKKMKKYQIAASLKETLFNPII